jgi:hypothetical protein
MKHVSYLENRSDRWFQLREITSSLTKDESVESCFLSAVEPETLAQLCLSYKGQVTASKNNVGTDEWESL